MRRIFFSLVCCSLACTATSRVNTMNDYRKTADAPPQKVVIATVMRHFTGKLEARIAEATRWIDQAAVDAPKKYHGRGVDLVVLPEHAIQSELRTTAKEKAVPLEGLVLDTFSALARKHHTYIVLPMIRAEGDRYTNVAVLIDRQGKVVGIYSKVHPVSLGDGTLEAGISPGESFPVFDCDFGKIGIQICWDMSFEDGFDALSRKGAEIVCIPSASPQTVRPATYALRGRYYVVTSTPRDNATIFNPVGMVAAQITSEGVLVHEIDLSYAVLHWSINLHNGQALTKAFGDRVGYQYSEREDTGVFWSNDPKTPIGDMIRQLNLRQMQEHTEHDQLLQDKTRGRRVDAGAR